MSSQSTADLEAFDSDPALAELEKKVNSFNIFDVLKVSNLEIRHSNFLAWLFDPHETHNLGETFLEMFLEIVLSDTDYSTYNKHQTYSENLKNSQVKREWENIDLLIVNEPLRFVVTIENKIHSRESIGQLEGYREQIDDTYNGYNRVFVYLSLGRDEPSDKNYTAMSYSQIILILNRIMEAEVSSINSNVKSAISQYITALEKQMPESEIQQLCRDLYVKHRAAIDLINEVIPDAFNRGHIRPYLIDWVQQNPGLILDMSVDQIGKSMIRFLPLKFDELYEKGGPDGPWPSGRILLFEFEIRSDKLTVALTIGPGDSDVRQNIHDKVKQHKTQNSSLPVTPRPNLTDTYSRVYSKILLNETELEDMKLEDMESTDIIDILEPRMEKIADDIKIITEILRE